MSKLGDDTLELNRKLFPNGIYNLNRPVPVLLDDTLGIASKSFVGDVQMAKIEPVPTSVVLDPNDGGEASEELLAFEREIKSKVVGQDKAINAIVDAYRVYLSSMQAPNRPLASLLFLGPTGTGKTRAVEAASEAIFGTINLVKVDCAEYQHSHEISKLIGSPPGYIGHRETPAYFTNERLYGTTSDKKLAFVLFDEIEKANDALWDLLLGVLDKGKLKLGSGEEVDFTNAMIFMTSNLGASEISKIGASIGFFVPKGDDRNAKIDTVALGAAKRKFSPEFVNRLTDSIVFHPLEPEHLTGIFELEIRKVQDRILNAKCPAFVLRHTEAAAQHLIVAGTSVKYGARELNRTIEKQVVTPLSTLILQKRIDVGDFVTIDVQDGHIIFLHQYRE